ncbi:MULTISPECIES: ROK family transcriptional regulator [Petrotoga]|uniref:ROK family transcriptional regulator n=2 Tax=Petrotoga sibirica TaxID=156202 RepID=A0A855MS38_9BACT|nr:MULTISPECIES: ROK family transcriptional regulator [Petrotoga]POZ89026.1 hypothetical protein AA80_02595 [Petrotoga sibirica DSM 13575]POZ91599.1 hypothetical protein AD60_02335 [Petrotoga sp. SL27]TDX13214.1 putative NBD/HSP70 family sugar kinase [Petrotoga sibirica]
MYNIITYSKKIINERGGSLITEHNHVKGIRNINRYKILTYIYNHKIATKAEISKKLKISAPTVSRNLEPYLNNLVLTSGMKDSKLGRKAEILELNEEYKILGIQIENEFIIYGIYNLKNEVLDSKKRFLSDYDSITELCAQLEDELKKLKTNILSVVVGISGYVSKDGIINSSALRINGSNVTFLVETLKKLFPNALTAFENDANLLAIKERFYSDKKVKNVVCIYWGKGVGMGLIIDEMLYVGKGRAGELGSILTNGQTLEKYIDSSSQNEVIKEWMRLLRNIYYVLQPDKIVLNCTHQEEMDKIIEEWDKTYPNFNEVKIHRSEESAIVEGAAILAIELYLKKVTVGLEGENVY